MGHDDKLFTGEDSTDREELLIFGDDEETPEVQEEQPAEPEEEMVILGDDTKEPEPEAEQPAKWKAPVSNIHFIDRDEDMTIIGIEEEWKPDGKVVKARRTHFWPIFFGILLVLIIAAAALGFVKVKRPHDQAYVSYANAVAEYNGMCADYNANIDAYNAKAAELNEENSKLDEAISLANQAVMNNELAYDETLRKQLSTSLEKAKEERQDNCEMFDHVTEIQEDPALKKLWIFASQVEAATQAVQADIESLQSKTAEMQNILGDLSGAHYDKTIALLGKKTEELQNSCQVMAQITNPAEIFVEERLKSCGDISAVRQVTTEHDPEGLLTNGSGCQQCLYYAATVLNPEGIADYDLVEQGIAAGGSVEVYENEGQAITRCTQLSAVPEAPEVAEGEEAPAEEPQVSYQFTLGTMVIRMSPSLSQEQVDALLNQITEALTRVDQ